MNDFNSTNTHDARSSFMCSLSFSSF